MKPKVGSELFRLWWLPVLLALLLPTTAGAPLLDGEPVDLPAPPTPESPTPAFLEATATLLKDFALSLPLDPRTGYGWRLVSYERDYLQLQRRQFRKPPAGEAGGAEEIFIFLPHKTGTTTVTFHYQRPFDRQPTASRTYRITIR